MIGSWIGRFILSVVLGLAGSILLGPACTSIAHAQGLEVAEPAEATSFGITALVAVWAPFLAVLTEWVRGFVPAWRRGVNADPRALAAVDRFRALGGAVEDVEVLRALAVATGGPGPWAKTLLRIVPVVIGSGASWAMNAAGVDPTYNPGVIGGTFAGLLASQFGGSLVKAVRDRLPGAGSARVASSAEEEPS